MRLQDKARNFYQRHQIELSAFRHLTMRADDDPVWWLRDTLDPYGMNFESTIRSRHLARLWRAIERRTADPQYPL